MENSGENSAGTVAMAGRHCVIRWYSSTASPQQANSILIVYALLCASYVWCLPFIARKNNHSVTALTGAADETSLVCETLSSGVLTYLARTHHHKHFLT